MSIAFRLQWSIYEVFLRLCDKIHNAYSMHVRGVISFRKRGRIWDTKMLQSYNPIRAITCLFPKSTPLGIHQVIVNEILVTKSPNKSEPASFFTERIFEKHLQYVLSDALSLLQCWNSAESKHVLFDWPPSSRQDSSPRPMQQVVIDFAAATNISWPPENDSLLFWSLFLLLSEKVSHSGIFHRKAWLYILIILLAKSSGFMFLWFFILGPRPTHNSFPLLNEEPLALFFERCFVIWRQKNVGYIWIEFGCPNFFVCWKRGADIINYTGLQKKNLLQLHEIVLLNYVS